MKKFRAVKGKYLAIFFIVLVGLYLRLIGINKPSGMWFDELYSFYIASQSFPLGILDKLYNEDFHAPLYFFLFHFWMKIFGEGDIILRLFSVLWGVLSIPITYIIGEKYFNRKTGLFAAVFLSLSSFHIYYSQEVRFYSFLVFLSLLSILFVLRFMQKTNKSSFVSLLLSNLCLLYTSTIGVIFVGVQFLVVGLYLFLKNKKKYFKYLYLSIISGILFSPYIPFIFHHIAKSNESLLSPFSWAYWDFASIFVIIQNWFSPVIIGLFNNPSGYFSYIVNSFSNLEFWLYILIPTGICLCGLINGLIKKNTKNLIIFLIVAIFGLIELILTLNGKMGLISRYTLIIFPLVIINVSYGLSKIKKNVVFVLICTLLFSLNIS